MGFRGFAFLALGCLAAQMATAASNDSCMTVGINESGFRRSCRSKTSSSPGEVRPTGADGVSTTPASLPVAPTPWGVEFIASSQPGKNNVHYGTAGIIRGFKGFGLGFGSDTGGTFYSNRAAAPVDRTFPSIPGINLGGAFALPFFDPKSGGYLPIVGAAVKFNLDAGTQGWATGINFAGQRTSFGASYQKEPADPEVPDQTNWSLFASGELGPLTLDLNYGRLHYVTSTGIDNSFNSYIATLSLSISRFMLVTAYRIVDGADTAAKRTQMHGLIFRVTPRIRIAYFYDYRPQSHSLGLQTLLF
jgi:hypothetical protein